MKYMKRAQIYKASNVTFNPKTLNAYSYSWWRFVALVDGKLIFNNYRYSPSTGKHQSKVRSLLNTLGIQIDLELPIPVGIKSQSLEELIVEAEETLCDKYLSDQLKKQEAYARTKYNKAKKQLEDYLETDVCFRDYDIKPKSVFGQINKVAVHQQVDSKSIAEDVNNALNSFSRDGFSCVVFYV